MPTAPTPVAQWILRYLSALLWLIVIIITVAARPGYAVTNGMFGVLLLLYGTGMALVPWFIGTKDASTAPSELATTTTALEPLCVLWIAALLAYVPFWLNEATALTRTNPPSESLRAATGILALCVFLLCGSVLSLISCFTLKRGWLFLLAHVVPVGLAMFLAE